MLSVKILSDKEFDSLPYKNAKTSLGCADKKTNTAYIRATKFPKVNLLTLDHEIEELFSKHSQHEVEGIRYLSFTDFLNTATNLFGTVGGAVQGYQNSSESGNNLATNILSGLTGAQSGSNLAKNVTGAITSAKDLLTGTGTLGEKVGGLADILGKVTGGTNILDQAGVLSTYPTGSLEALNLPSYPDAPQLGETVAKWLTTDTVTKAGEAAKSIADELYMGTYTISTETQALMDTMETDIRKNYEDRIKQLDKSMLAVNEQWARSGERIETIRRIQEEEEQEVNNMRTEWVYKEKTDFATKQYDYIMKQLDIDNQAKQDLLYADVWTVTEQYNIDKQDVEDFRNIAVMSGLYDKILTQQGVDPAAAKTQVENGSITASGLISAAVGGIKATTGLLGGSTAAGSLAGLLGSGGTTASSVAGGTLLAPAGASAALMSQAANTISAATGTSAELLGGGATAGATAGTATTAGTTAAGASSALPTFGSGVGGTLGAAAILAAPIALGYLLNSIRKREPSTPAEFNESATYLAGIGANISPEDIKSLAESGDTKGAEQMITNAYQEIKGKINAAVSAKDVTAIQQMLSNDFGRSLISAIYQGSVAGGRTGSDSSLRQGINNIDGLKELINSNPSLKSLLILKGGE